jgi:hypothetical protein
MLRISAVLAVIAVLSAALAGAASAHHSPTLFNRDKIVILEGFVSDEMDGFPHWQIKVRMAGKDYNVDLGSEYILREAGLHEDGRDFRIGDTIKVEGFLPANPSIIRILPIRIHIHDRTYELKTHEF